MSHDPGRIAAMNPGSRPQRGRKPRDCECHGNTTLSRRGDLRFAQDHESPMASGFPPRIGAPWATADRSPPPLAPSRRGDLRIAQDHESPMASGIALRHWQFMGNVGGTPTLLDARQGSHNAAR